MSPAAHWSRFGLTLGRRPGSVAAPPLVWSDPQSTRKVQNRQNLAERPEYGPSPVKIDRNQKQHEKVIGKSCHRSTTRQVLGEQHLIPGHVLASVCQWRKGSPESKEAGSCRGFVQKARNPKWPFAEWFMQWATATGCIERICPERLTWYLRDGGRLYSCMAAFGTSMTTRAAAMQHCQVPIGTSGTPS